MGVRLDYVKRERGPVLAFSELHTSPEPAWLCGLGPALLALMWTGCGFQSRHTPTHPTAARARTAKFELDFSCYQPVRAEKERLCPSALGENEAHMWKRCFGDVQRCCCCLLFLWPLLTSYQWWTCHCSIIAAGTGSKVTAVARADGQSVCLRVTVAPEIIQMFM